MKKFALSLMAVALVSSFAASSLRAECGCTGKDSKDKKEEPKKEEPKKS